MKKLSALLFIILFSICVSAQKPKRKPAASSGKATSSAATVADEKTEFERAVAVADAAERIKALRKFAAAFPNSSEKNRALELVASARAAIADEKMRGGDAAGGVALFKSAIEDAPAPISDKLFADVILQIPANLYFRGERGAAADAAGAIEAKAAGNAKQILGLATFFLGIENADEAKRLAEKAAAIDPNLPAVYQTLGLANRLNFDLAAAAGAYEKALELDVNSSVSKRSLAEMKRAVGKSDEAVALYREILDKNPADAVAANGLILALFDAGKGAEAESEMQKSLAANPNNFMLLVGAAYSYAAGNDAARAVELAQKAIAIEPRYVWSYVALARGFLKQNKLYDAERALLQARAYGNFPTLDYELATVRAAGGFYREAAEELSKSFTVKDDSVGAKLGGRVEKSAGGFIELLADERRASIFEPRAADDAPNAQRLKSLLDFYQKSESAGAAASDAEIADAAEKFINDGGGDGMKLHRRLFAADRLLKKKKALGKAAEFMKGAPAEVDAALNVPNASSAVLADELYESRAIAIAKNQLVIVPQVQRQTLSSVVRGRIEEISGELLLEDNKTSDAVVRLKRAVSVLPEKSAWWRASQWRLGVALEADGKDKEALEAFIKNYTNEAAYNPAKRLVIESVYQKINGSLDGLDARIGAKPDAIATATATTQKPEVAQNQIANATVAVSPKVEAALPIAETKLAPTEKIVAVPAPKVEPTPDKIADEKEIKTAESTQVLPADSSVKIEPEIKEKETPKTETREPETGAAEPKSVEPKQTETAAAAPKKEKPQTAPKSIFEPIIITVPKTESAKKSKPEDKRPDAPEKSTDDAGGNNSSDAGRARVIVSDDKTEQTKCDLTFSQASVSLINNGGNLGILVGLDGDGDAKEITASSSSAADVEVALQPEIGAASNRAYFVFKSVSRKTGVFTVTFEAPCGGKKEFTVKVR